jgi:hypothetical protein
MFDIHTILSNSMEYSTKYSHDCWGSGTSEKVSTLCPDKLKENILNELLKILNQQLQDLDRSNFDEVMIIFKTIHNTKKLLRMELS